MAKYRYALQTIIYGGEFDADRVFGEAREAGYQGIEFAQTVDSLGDVEKIAAKLEEYDLQAVCMMAGSTGGRVDWAIRLDAPFAGGWDDAGWEQAKAHGIRFISHPHWLYDAKESDFLLVPGRIWKSLEDHPDLVLCPDIAHMTVMRQDPARWIRFWRDRVQYGHLKDWKSSFGTGNDYYLGFCELGQGDVDIPAVFGALEEINFEGWLTVEQDVTSRPTLESINMSMAYLKALGVA